MMPLDFSRIGASTSRLVLLFQQLRQVIFSTLSSPRFEIRVREASPVNEDADGRTEHGISIVLAPSTSWWYPIMDL
jgi:hypothetical protein